MGGERGRERRERFRGLFLLALRVKERGERESVEMEEMEMRACGMSSNFRIA